MRIERPVVWKRGNNDRSTYDVDIQSFLQEIFEGDWDDSKVKTRELLFDLFAILMEKKVIDLNDLRTYCYKARYIPSDAKLIENDNDF